MSKRAKRAKTLLRKQSILGEKIDEALLRRYGLSNTEDNSVMQEKLKEEKVDVAPDTSFTHNIVEEMISEVETMVEEINTIVPEPVLEKPKPRIRRRRTAANKKTTNTRKKKVEKN